jgi:phosphate transport system substrate-binding protein
LLVDETFGPIIESQLNVFNEEYPDAKFTVIKGSESKIVPTFLNDSVRVMISSRLLTPEEKKGYLNRGIQIKTSRFAIDGIALIINKDNIDSTIDVNEVIAILKGESKTGNKLVFDNAYSSTIRYFKTLAKINALPSEGVYTLKTNSDVIKYIAENRDYIGVVGVNWLIAADKETNDDISKVRLMGVKNLAGKKGDDQFYKPTQANLIKGVYPFLRNIYIHDGEGRNGLGTGFASWLNSHTGQLIVLKSGLGPHKIEPREINLKNTN